MESTGAKNAPPPCEQTNINNLFCPQECIELGQTLGIMLLGSDKTHLMVTQGDKECHTIYLTCSNIKKKLQMKVGACCWMMVTQIPIAKFNQVEH